MRGDEIEVFRYTRTINLHESSSRFVGGLHRHILVEALQRLLLLLLLLEEVILRCLFLIIRVEVSTNVVPELVVVFERCHG